MTRSSRLFDLIQILRRHRNPVAGSKLAAELEVSVRTLYRDIATLQQMGAEIDGEAGIGYVLRPSFMLPPLMFTPDEIQALAVGLQWVTRQTDDGLADAASDAIAKIGAVLPADMRGVLDDNALHVARRASAPHSETVQLFRMAIRGQDKVRLTYCDPSGSTTERVIWPIALGFFGTERIVAGWCELRTAYRSFRIDRMLRAESLAERYPGRRSDMVRQWRSIENTADKN